MASIGPMEILVVLVVALIVLGPAKLPESARSVGRAFGEFKRVVNSAQAEVRDVLSDVSPTGSYSATKPAPPPVAGPALPPPPADELET